MTTKWVFGASLAAALISAAIFSSQAALAITGPGCIIVGSDGNPHVVTPFTVNTGQVPGSPANSCQECNLSGPGGLTGWSPIPGSNGSACNTPCSGGTGALAIPAGQCSASPNGNGTVCNNGFCDYGCWIGSTPAGCNTAPDPANPDCTGGYNYYSADLTPANTINESGSGGCMTCQPAATPYAWTPITNDTPCGAGDECESGLCVSTCLTINPNSINFGTTTQQPGPPPQPYCASSAVTVTLSNSCTTSIAVNPPSEAATHPAGQFILGAGGVTSPNCLSGCTLTSGQSASFTVQYAPVGAGIPTGHMVTSVTSTAAVEVVAPALGTYVVPVIGTASGTATTNTDAFTVPAKNTQVDMLWVIDNDDGNGSWANTDYNLVQNFVTQAVAANLDLNMALITTGNAYSGTMSSTTKQVWNTVIDGPAAVASNITTMWNNIAVCDCGPADECMMDATYAALCHAAGVDGCAPSSNQGFLRPNALLAVQVIEDDNEDDHGYYYLPAGEPAYKTFLWSLKGGNPALVSWSYASAGAAVIGGPVSSLVTDTNGIGPTASQGQPSDFGALGQTAINNMVNGLVGHLVATAQQIFNLTETPTGSSCGGLSCGGGACPGTLFVYVAPASAGLGPTGCSACPGGSCPAACVQTAYNNGTNPWCYNSVNNTINFQNAQAGGDAIAVTYTAVCNP